MSIEPVILCFSVLVGLAVARTLPALVRFYADFSTSGLALADHRGYGQSACKAFGLIPAPKLSVRAMAASGVAFLALVVLPATPPRAMRARCVFVCSGPSLCARMGVNARVHLRLCFAR